jgi:phage shock protein C
VAPAGAGGGIVVLRFQRAKRDRWLLGVCGGLARAQGWSPNIVRLVTAVLAIAIPGFSLIPVLVIYIILGAVLPESDEF